MDRFQSEADLASEYPPSCPRRARIPDAMAVSRDWAARYLQMLAEDGKHLADAPEIHGKGSADVSNGLSAEQAAATAAAAA